MLNVRYSSHMPVYNVDIRENLTIASAREQMALICGLQNDMHIEYDAKR